MKRFFSTTAKPVEALDSVGMRSLATLLVLAQLPHLLHLPIWVSVVGILIVVFRLYAQKNHVSRVYRWALSGPVIALVAFVLAGLIYWHYGYFLGRDPCVGFLFLLVACKFAELRRQADATLLMCLSGFLLLTQYFYSQSILSALITLPAVFALGHALIVTRSRTTRQPLKHNLQLIGKLLIQGAPLALLLFVVFPRLPGPLWSLPEDAQAKTGLSDSMSPGSISKLTLSDEVAFRVEFNDAIPSPSERYFRGPVLPNFDGYKWTTDTIHRQAVPAIADENSLQYTVILQPHRQRWLFALEQPVRLQDNEISFQQNGVSMHYTADGQLLSRTPVTSLTRYQVASQLSDSYSVHRKPPRNTLQLPGINTRTIAKAREFKQRSANPAEYAQNILSWFNRENFSYTLTPSLLGDTPVDEFLFQTKEGFCEHYAQAFVVLMRAAGIPARVVTGYQGGRMNGDYMIVRQSDAHAWAEAFVNGRWQRYDPTAAVAPSRVVSGLADSLPEWGALSGLTRGESNWLTNLQLRMDRMNHNWQRWVVDFNNDSQQGLLEQLGLPKPKLWQLITLVLVVSAIWCVFIVGVPIWPRRRRRHTLKPAEHAWQRYEHALQKQGLTRRSSETPNEFIDRAADLLPEHAHRIRSLGKALSKWRFAALHSQEEERIQKSVAVGLRVGFKRSTAK
ncbi:MAG: DUF3488 and transglutaminase-like domain-containing protein [Gammaproteobacteria bacterium]|nr:DUF3488 and transglutaminase-like domain-containing protein [Gammaproteobacteria bacterium]